MTTIDIVADDGATLHVTLHGAHNAPPLLLLHSIGCDHTMWAPQVAALRGRFRLVTQDIRGHGASSARDMDYTLERLARDAGCVLDHLKLATAHVCGLSLGGAIAQWLAIHVPARIHRLVLANTAARIGSAQAWQTRLDTVRRDGLAAIADLAMQRFFAAEFVAAHREIVAAAYARLLTTSSAGYAGCCAALRDADLSGSVSRIAAPTLVIAGAHDIATPLDQMRALAAAIPGSRFELLAAAHLSNLEQPAAFTAAVARHLGTP